MLVEVDVGEIHKGILTLHTVLTPPIVFSRLAKHSAEKEKRNCGIRPFKDMSVAELQRECRAWGLCNEGYKKDLQMILKEHLQLLVYREYQQCLSWIKEESIKDLHLGM